MKRPFAMIKSARGAELLVGPLDNHEGAGAGQPENKPLPWKSEAQAQLPLVEAEYYGEVFWMDPRLA